ncbi:unnamed protein product, partial [Caenorhabditis auriculariae]
SLMFSAWTTRSPGGSVLRDGHPVAAWLTDVLAEAVRPSGRWALDFSRSPVGRSRRPAVILSANDVASPAMLPPLNVLFEVLDLGPLTEVCARLFCFPFRGVYPSFQGSNRLEADIEDINIDGKTLTNLRFADDIVLFANNTSDHAQRSRQKIGLQMNEKKTQWMRI